MISIIIPVYNVEKYLRRCLDSILAQSYEDIEIILIDDGSTDTSPQICDEYKKLDERVVVVHKCNGGVVSARNKGLEIAKGDYIGFIDSDDYVAEDMFQYLMQIQQETDADICCCGICRRYTKYNKSYNTISIDGIAEFSKEEALYRFQLNNYIGVTVWNKIFKRDIVKSIKFEKYKRLDDARFVCKAILNSEKIAFGSDIKYIYEIRNNSITRSGFNTGTYDILKVSDLNYSDICAIDPPKTFDYMVCKIIWYTVFTNEMIMNRAKDPDVINGLKTMIRSNWEHIKNNDDLGLVRKGQYYILSRSFSIYSLFYRLFCLVTGR